MAQTRFWVDIPEDPISLITDNTGLLNDITFYPDKLTFDPRVIKAIFEATYTDTVFNKEATQKSDPDLPEFNRVDRQY